MTEADAIGTRVLYCIVCAALPAIQTPNIVTPLQEAGWDVCVIATPQASRWIDRAAIESLTGHLVRTDYKLPGEADPLPKADAMLVMPTTFNTINKWAQGIGDTLVASILCESLGRRTPPVVAVLVSRWTWYVILLSKRVLLCFVSVVFAYSMSQKGIRLL